MASPATTAQATYTIGLRDEVSATTQNIGSALDALRQKMADEQRQIGELEKAMRRLKAGGLGKSDAMQQLKDQAAALRVSIGRSQEQFLALGGTFKATAAPAKTLVEQLQGAPGPLGAAASRVSALSGALSTAAGVAGLAVIGIGAVVAVLGAIVAAAGAAGAALASYAVSVANARRNELLHLEGLTSVRNWMGIAAGSASELQASIDRVSDSTSLGRQSVMGYAEQLYRAGLRGHDLESALEGVTTTAAVQGDRWAQRFAGMAISAARTGRSVDRLAQGVRDRLGGIAGRQVLALDVQMRRMREGIASLFEGINIDGFLRSLSEVTGMFSQSTVTGRALRTVISALFGPIFDSAGDAQKAIRNFVEQGVIFALRLTLAFFDVRDAIAGMIPTSAVEALGNFINSGAAGRLALAGLAAGAVTLTAVLGALAVVAGVVLAPIVAASAAAFAAGYAFGSLLNTGRELYTWFSQLDWSGIGRNLIDGLVAGINRGRELVAGAVRGIAETATSTLRRLLEIRSPSRVFAGEGLQIPRGLAQGIERGAPIAAQAVGGLTDSVSSAFRAEEAAPGSAISNSATSTVNNFYIEVRANGGSGEEIATSIREELTRFFEEAAYQRGGSLA